MIVTLRERYQEWRVRHAADVLHARLMRLPRRTRRRLVREIAAHRADWDAIREAGK